MQIRSKLLINTIIVIICLGIVGGIGFYYTHNIAKISLSLYKLEVAPVLKINALETIAWKRWLILTEHSGIYNYEMMQTLEIEIVKLDKQIKDYITAIDNIYTLNAEEAEKVIEHILIFNKFKKNWRQFQQIAEQILALSQEFTKEDALNLIVGDGKQAYNKAITSLNDLVEHHRIQMNILRDNVLQARREAMIMITLLTFLIALFALILITHLTKKILVPLLLVNSRLKLLAKGQAVKENIEYKGDDEIAEIILSSTQLKNSIEETINQINAVANGDYDRSIEIRFKEDKLSQALHDMTNVLRNMTNNNANQNWLKTGQTQLHEQMSGDLTLADLAHNVISFLTLYVEGQVGICYLVEKFSDGLNQNIKLKQIASYAYTRRKNMGDEFEFSEGLVEKAAKSQKIIAFSFSTQISEEMPQHIFMIPFLYENNVTGVLVLCSMQPFTQIQQNFIEQVVTGIGIAFNSVESRTKIQDLLQQTQIQTQELIEQKETLQNQTEELQCQKEELQAQSEEMQAQQEELRQTNEMLEERTRSLEQQKIAVQEKNQILEINRIEMEKSQAAIMLKAEELELASKYKSEFLANMSHELRTPLNSLLILAQLLADNKSGNLTEKQIEYAKTINSAGKDLLKLINDILDLSKVEAGKIEIHWEEMLLDDLLTSISQKFFPIAEDKKLQFITNIATNINPILKTDGQRLKQIINNLLSNAFKFTSEGSVIIEVQYPTEIPLSIKDKKLELNNTIAISVIDTGIGIPKDKQQSIFEAFQQADGSTSRRYGGTGLGLSISRQLARLLGGELTLTSDNKGSKFTLYLPTDKLVTKSAPTNEQLTKKAFSKKLNPDFLPKLQPISDDRNDLQPNDKSILIIEDDRKFSKILMELAIDKGFKYLLAEDGIVGVKLAEQYIPSAIILDVGLPELNGWSVMERLKDNPATRHIPVHFISAVDQSVDAKKMGAIGYLLKPVSMEKLTDAFKQIEQFLLRTVKNLLIVTDIESHKQKIIELVNEDNIKIKQEITVQTAFQNLQTVAYDCIILDIDIEHGSGSELLEMMYQEKNYCQIPIIVYTDRDLTIKEETLLMRCSDEIPIKKVSSPERLLDETILFLHQIEDRLPSDKRNMLHMVHDKEAILKHKKILIVDDDVRNIYALATVLEEHDMEVICSVNGQEGLEQLQENDDIAIILMDIMMPEMDGYAAMQEIRKQPKYNKLPIIALTAKAMKDDKAKCIEAGANDYLAKPVDADKLMSLMRVWLYR
ncbi:MAG TPA: response regulator [Thioploca sp.]|nr:response regulator [Thioploca sp.]